MRHQTGDEVDQVLTRRRFGRRGIRACRKLEPTQQIRQLGGTDVEADRQVGEVAEARTLLDAAAGAVLTLARGLGKGVAHESVGERIGQQCLGSEGQVVPRLGQVGQGGDEGAEVGDCVGLGVANHAGGDIAQPLQRLQELDQVVPLVVDDPERVGQVVQRAGDGCLLTVRCDREAIDLLQRREQRSLVVIELADERGGRPEELLDLGLVAAQSIVELLDDGVGLLEPTTVEQQRCRAEDFLELGVATRAVERDRVAVPELADGSHFRRCERDELLAQQAGLADRRLRVVGQDGVLVDLDRDDRGPAIELDVGDLADRDVVDPDRTLRHEVEHVTELDLDGVGLVAEVGATRQGQLVGRETAAAEREGRRRCDRPGTKESDVHVSSPPACRRASH